MRFLVLALILAVIPSSTRAQPTTGANGGPVVVADGHAIEMLATDRELVFHLLDDDGSPLATAGVSARIVLRADGKTLTLPLTAAPPNKLSAALPSPLPPGSKIVFAANIPGHNLQARFER